jgi:hypothetical protein
MKGKLIKISGIYTLMCDDKMIASDDVDFQSDYQIGKLSLKNCESIENGYDLDELSKKETRKFIGHDVPENIMLFISHNKMFQKGFQKALEILGDKKFSEDDIKKALEFDKFENEFNNKFYESQESFIQSLQQTEWDCIIEMECVTGCKNLILNGENSVCCGDKKPKLDAENCLILKRL